MGTYEKACFEKNMALLEKNHFTEWQKVSEYKEVTCRTETELVSAGNNKPNLKINLSENNAIYIHNMDEPDMEPEAFFSTVEEDSTGVVLILGMGLGYSALAIAKKLKKIQHIIIFELNIEFFIHGLNQVDLTELLTDKRVIFSLGEPDNLAEILSPANRALMLEDIHTHKLGTCFQVNSSYYKLSDSVFEYISDYNMEGATKTKHGRAFFENRIKHLTSIHHDNLLEDLADKFRGVPALIVAAGPSLDKNIDQIHRAVGKSVIISVDSALPSLLSHGIKPDFVTSIDYQKLTYEKIAGMASNPLSKEINLICTSWVTPVVPKNFPAKNIFWTFSHTDLENWINRSMGGTTATGGAGTVAHLNIISAKTMGCDPVIFVGQDLAYSDNMDHSSNVVLTDSESMNAMLEHGQDILWVKGVNGPDVPTSRAFFSYKLAFERMIESLDGKFINSTEGGAEIVGAENIPLGRAIDMFCTDPVGVDVNFSNGRVHLAKSMKTTLNKVKKLEKTINAADRLASSVLKDVNRIKHDRENFTSISKLSLKLQKKIIELDSAYNKADKNQLWGFFDDMTMEGMREDEREQRELEILETIPEQYLEWLSKSVVRTDKVNKLRTKNLGRFKRQLVYLIDYHTKEKFLLDKIARNNYKLSEILELAKMYCDSENHALLEHLLEEYKIDNGAFAEVNYYYGLIALHRGEYKKADYHFQVCVNADEAYKQKVFDKRHGMADRYFEMVVFEKARLSSGVYSKVLRYLLLKGLSCCPDHGKLRDFFGNMVEDDLQSVRLGIEARDKDKIQAGKQLIEHWVGAEPTEKELQNFVEKGVIAEFYRLYGNILLDEKEYQKALDNYQKALTLLPDDPDIYISVTDTCFALDNFDSGIEFLRKAVELDRGYAAYWNNIGDTLQAQEDYNSAIMAYEQYFMALPEQIEALKKMGDCYKKLGNIDAAYEAYQQFKKMVENR